MDDQYYDPTNPKYKCCCGCHVTIATRIICWINIIIVAVIVLCTIYFNDEGPYDEPEINGSSVVLLIIAALVPVITAVTPLYGLKVENHKWLIPFLVVNILAIIGLTLSFLVTLYQLFVENDLRGVWGFPRYYREDDKMLYVFVILRGILPIPIQSWFFLIVYRCYEYLKAKGKGGSLPSRR